MTNWRLFEWQYIEPKYPVGDWRNREEPYWIGKYRHFTARIVAYNNTQYTWEISWPTPISAFSKTERGDGCANESVAMLLADRWLYLYLNPQMEQK